MLNWGKGITIVIFVFVAIIGYMVYTAVSQDDIFLVADDYYKEELKYQEVIDKINNYNNLQEKPTIALNDTTSKLTIVFPKTMEVGSVKGNLWLMRPNDAKQDRTFNLDLDVTNQQTIDLKSLPKGMFRARLTFSYKEKEYIHNLNIFNK